MPLDVAGDEAGQSSHDWQDHDAPSPSASIKSDNDLDDDNERSGGPSQPIQKRRRVTRACDECRRKKIKCDGKQPCTHCSVYSYECTYDKPSNRRRNPAPQYIEALESRLQRAESLLHKFMPDVDLADPNLDPAIQQEFRNRENARTQAAKSRQPPPSQPAQNDAHLTSMIDSVGQLDLDEKGSWDFHGISSGAVFLKRMKEHFRGMLGPSKTPFLPRAERPAGLDSPSLSSVGTPFSAVPSYPELPAKDVARKLCYYSLSCATCLVRIVHVPTFYEQMDKIYDRPLDNLTKEETQYLGLLFSVMALGCMYNNLDDNDPASMAYQDATEEGLKYYNAARSLLHDMTDCRDLISLQALLFIILFLQATSNLNSCYSFVGIALRSSLRIGLHRHLQHERMDPIEQEVRKRVFYVVRQMDIYVSTLLGFPLLLNVDDIDQPFPLELDDEFITHTGILRPPPGSPSFIQAFNAHSELMEILAKVTKYVYPTKGLGQGTTKDDKPASTYLISYGRIKEIEAELHSWFEKLPQHWRPSGEGPIETVRIRHLLRFAYAHVQLVLYRPFLHYVSPRLSQGTKVDELSYACAAAAISVSRNIVHIGLEIRKQRVLSGPYWFMLYTEFFAVLSLVFYATENPEKPGSGEVLADARAGRQMIASLAEKSMSAERVTSALDGLFNQLPEQLDAGAVRQVPSKKRSAPTVRPSSVSSHHTPVPASMTSLGTTDFTRTSQISTSSYPTTLSQGTMDMHGGGGGGGGITAFQDNTFSPSFAEFMTPDMQQSTPESSSSAATHPYMGQQLGVHNPVNKLDSLMFPSEDPFAYPNQPMMELGYPNKTDQPTSMGDSTQDMQLFLTGTFDDVESQIFGQPPPYMMHQQGQPMMGATGHPMPLKLNNYKRMAPPTSPPKPVYGDQRPQAREGGSISYEFVLEDEFDALCVEVKKSDDDFGGRSSSSSSSSSGNKYPAKLHARKVVAELGVADGLVYLPGEPTRLYEDSDQSPPFKQRRYFYYLSGADFPDCAVTYEIATDRLTLWIPYAEPRQILYHGPTPDAAEAMRRYDVDDVRYTAQLSKFLAGHLRPEKTLYVLHSDQAPKLTDRPRGQTQINCSKLRPAMDQARVVKTDYEVALIRRASRISAAAHRAVAERLLTMRNEQDVEAVFLAACTSRGAHTQAYPIIAGAGVNASILHYGANNQPLEGKQLICVDAGCEWQCYASDITRTLPIGGAFSNEAAAIHAIVQRMQDECISRVRPGTIYYELHLHASDVALQGLRKLGLLRGSFDEIQKAGTVAAFFPHGLGHHVGLEVHDVTGSERLLMRDNFHVEGGKREMVTATALVAMQRMASAPSPTKPRQALQPNMIVTIEPGIYFCRPFIEGYFLNNPSHAKFINRELLEQYYSVGGIRIEDDILVTHEGYENLTFSAPKGDELLDVINGSFEKL
ncbi:hypothetical protein F66182_4586 [Fusarium sp. NRRL 66182]|nr:hypothetical protein F66182_4586 [Fusarium sp. NRRL 66182]